MMYLCNDISPSATVILHHHHKDPIKLYKQSHMEWSYKLDLTSITLCKKVLPEREER